jgi:NAD(P)-dependent dehydrogenase (short-subunit alcohol dehydrogenase family)
MRVVIFGACGTIGKAVAAELAPRHDLIRVGRSSGDYRADMTDLPRVRALLQELGNVDALVCAAGSVHFGPLAQMTPELLEVGLKDKLMGQVNLVLAAQDLLNDNGSITLTSGILSRDPIRFGSSASMVNGAIDSFIRAAAIELPRGLRVNAVSPTVIEDSMELYGTFFRGYEPVSARRAALAYSKSVEGAQTGQVYRVE